MSRYTIVQTHFHNSGIVTKTVLLETDSIDEVARYITRVANKFDIDTGQADFMYITYIEQLKYCFVKCHFEVKTKDANIWYDVDNTPL